MIEGNVRKQSAVRLTCKPPTQNKGRSVRAETTVRVERESKHVCAKFVVRGRDVFDGVYSKFRNVQCGCLVRVENPIERL